MHMPRIRENSFFSITMFGEVSNDIKFWSTLYDSDDDEWEMKKKLKNIELFLKKMPNLEQLIICYNHLAISIKTTSEA